MKRAAILLLFALPAFAAEPSKFTLAQSGGAADPLTVLGPAVACADNVILRNDTTTPNTLQCSALTVANLGDLTVPNATAAADGVQQASPSIVLTGAGWKTNAAAGSQVVNWKELLVPQQGAVNPGGYKEFLFQTNGLGYVRAGMVQFVPTAGTVDGWGNTTLGYNSGPVIFASGTAGSGYNNAFFGAEAGKTNDGGHQNTFLGSRSGFSNASGNQNTYVGQGAGYSGTSDGNVAVGWHALLNGTSGTANVAIGSSAGTGAAASTAEGNTFVGQSAGTNVTDGSFNVAVGYLAGTNLVDGDRNVLIGTQAGDSITSGNGNACVGRESCAALTTQSDVSAFGKLAGSFTTAAGGAFFGAGAGLVVTSGANNTCLGYQACYTATEANAVSTGDSNTYVGYNAGPGAASQFSNSSALGAGALTTASNQVVLGDASVTSILASADGGAAITAASTIVSLVHITPQASPPGSPTEGDIYADTSHALCYYDGSSWLVISGAGACS